jgi:DNA polymerase III epsilon subunit-like protein
VAVFDIETTGLHASCRIVQMCCMLCDRHTLEVLEQVSVIVKSDGFGVLASDIHGITEEISSREGEPFVAAAMQINALFSKASAVIAHNVNFDLRVFRSELSRYGLLDVLETVQSLQPICSMQRTRRVCNLKKAKGGSKAPRLDELYRFATGEEIQNHHNAIYDVDNLRRAMQILLEEGKIDLE